MFDSRTKKRKEYCENHLAFSSKDFDIAEEYFSEAKECYVNGLYKASIVMAVSALESALKEDYIRFLPDFEGNLGDEEKRRETMTDPKKKEAGLYNLLGMYFRRFKRLPPKQELVKERIVQIRNSVVHTKDDEIIKLSRNELEDYSKQVLDDVKRLMNHLNKLALSIGRCPKCQSDLEVVKAKDAFYKNRYVKCKNPQCDYAKRLYPNETPHLNDRKKTCYCGRPLVSGKTLKRGDVKSHSYERCLENCDLTPVRCKVCGGPMEIRYSKKTGIFFVCKDKGCKNTWS